MLTRKQSAFTLVEVLIVVIILGILAAAIMPAFSNAADDARASTTATIVKGLQRYAETQKIRTGSYPATFTAVDFQGSQLPINPYDPTPTTTFEIATGATTLHPGTKTIDAAGAFWYNKDNGIVRARVTAGADDAATIATYNAANATAITTIGQTN